MIAIFLSQTNFLAAGLSFNFTSCTAGDLNISHERAFPVEQAIQLANSMIGANDKTNFGRATYCKSMHLWDKASSNLTNFQTHFSFVIDSKSKFQYGDGLTFFLAPEGEHVGIDINSLKSVKNITWFCDIKEGKRNDAWISYNSSTHNLSVVFTGNDTLAMQYLSVIVDLRD
ncbi:hypothetical protein GH714_029278 [Hevea brasiliensis]|uniref:Legume lectin domain-containing protein n=1 Tax=Hevea brasiliensis TaxID=3981 RepID=A0A6A6N375_HEVBR|nr:hypothetical protein GH714_029029 [Hevea brasiliensis]KAF2320632.1 hypothetical protein GH714_029278 [Hevea brasiliensis]